ncbi:unnamed protein product [Arabis nemorensis]|uniref:SAGA-associated factor 11 n=1 Tax=Arabis nemorensis TaxID=586526 RepID=A0A565BP81_9BRAS|nr:unnamed protein product [Arabis nemorensis]
MVCSIGNGRMAVMARTLQGQSISQNVAGDVENQMIFARYIRKEIFEADEPNLLDEEDMHIFGLKPMDDPLRLVYCKVCKKPVKASHYATHADICVILSSTRNEKVELKCKTEGRKPQKKQKGNGPSVGAKGSSRDLMDADGIIPSETCEKHGSSSNIPKGTVTTTYKAGNLPRYTLPHSEKQNHNVVVDQTYYKNPHGNDMQYQAQADVPAPLATKIYYSQRSNRLRSEIGYMFHATDSQEIDDNPTVEATQVDITQSKISLNRSTPSGQKSCTGLRTVTDPQSAQTPKPLYEKSGTVQENQQQTDGAGSRYSNSRYSKF